MMSRQSVAVIGAGASGLAALRVFAEDSSKYDVVAFERHSAVGGVWNYSDDPRAGPMYANLKTNLPKETMAFPGFPFDANLPSFIRHTDVKAYLEDFCRSYGLEKFIRFRSDVKAVYPCSTSQHADCKRRWCVRWSEDQAGVLESHEGTFDSVILGSGHYDVPSIVDLPGSDVFAGTIMHSIHYRKPESFAGMSVALLGAGPSGQDIALDIAPYAESVILCHRKVIKSPLPSNLQEASAIEKLTEHGIVCSDGEAFKVDALILCVGYEYDFPFLRNDHVDIDTSSGYVPKLYKHIVHIDFHNLFFIGLCKIICPFPQFHMQASFVKAILDHRCQLPDDASLRRIVDEELRAIIASDAPMRYFHVLSDRQWAYNDELAMLAGVEKLDPVVARLYQHVHWFRVRNLQTYKDMNFRLVDAESFCEV